MHDVRFEECLQAAADAVGYEEDPRGKGLCVLLKGMQTPSRAAVTRRAHAGRLRRPLGVVRDGPGRAPLDPAHGRRAARVRARPGRAAGPRHRQLAVRHAHDLEPLDAHDGPRARPRRSRTCAPTAASAASARSATRAASTLTPARGSRRRTGTRAPRARASRVDEETGKVTVEHLHGVAYAGRVVNRPGRRAAERGLADHGPRDGAVRGDRLRRRPGRQRQPVRLQHPGARPTCRRASRTRSSSARGPTCTASGRRSCRRCPAAIGNALQSLGLRVHELPITAERVLAAVDAREGER